MLPELHKFASGALGISQAQNVVICQITPGKGRWTIRGSARHSLADGVKLSRGPIGTLIDVVTLPSAANGVATIPLITVDILNNVDVIVLRLAVATGGADSASGILSIQQETSI